MSHICDYEGSDYKARFWQNADRAYEDAAERIALRRLLPATGGRIAEFGAGFGRLADLYAGYDEVILLDYSRSLLEQARETWGSDARFTFVAADLYHLPFAPGALAAATMVRVIHHIADVAAALAQIRSAFAPGGTFVMEFASKRNLKSMVRYAARRQAWSPYDPQPVEFAALNFDFHPDWMMAALVRAGFVTRRAVPVSYLRAGVLKRLLPRELMVRADAALQRTAALGLWSPSVFVQCQAGPAAAPAPTVPREGLFVSPLSGGALRREGEALVCDADGSRWSASGNFFDFKERLS